MEVLLGPSVVVMASAVGCTADYGHGERQIWILPGLAFTLVMWVGARISLSPSFGKTKEFQCSKVNDFEAVVVVEKGDWYEDVLRPVIPGLVSHEKLNIKELMEFL